MSKLDDKVHFVKEVINAKPKQLTKTKKKIDKIELITDQIETSLDNTSLLLLSEFNFSPKQILNKKLIFNTTIIDKETIMDISPLKMTNNIGLNMNLDLIIYGKTGRWEIKKSTAKSQNYIQ